MRLGRSVLLVGLLAAAVELSGCANPLDRGPASEADVQATAMAATAVPRFQGGEKIRITVFNEPSLTGDYDIDPNGAISLPLAGTVTAIGLTQPQLEQELARKFRTEYLRNPKVTVTILQFRPIYMVGEIEKQGEFAFRPGLNVLTAMAMAGGGTYRANKSYVLIQHYGQTEMKQYPQTAATMILPGDLIRVPERYFEGIQHISGVRCRNTAAQLVVFRDTSIPGLSRISQCFLQALTVLLRQLKKSGASFLYWPVAVAITGLVSASYASAASLPQPAAVGAPVPMLVGGWELSPTMFAGPVYNSNVGQSTVSPVASWGARFVPGIIANFDAGIYKTRIYGVADVIAYGNSDVPQNPTVDAKAGFAQTYAPTRDLVFKLSGDYTRQADVFGSAPLANVNTFVPSTPSAPTAPVVVSPLANTNRYNQFSGAFSVDKSFGYTFVGLTANVTSTIFDSNPTLITNNGTVYTVTGRAGFNLTPQIYAFFDPSVNWQRYSNSVQDTNGYRVTGGVGTLAPGIWQGEIYGGYQANRNDIVGTYDSPVFGARVLYSPSRMWNFRLSVDETLNGVTSAVPGTVASGSRVATAILGIEYRGLPPDWRTTARFGYVRTDYVGFPRTDNGWLVGQTSATRSGATSEYCSTTSSSLSISM